MYLNGALYPPAKNCGCRASASLAFVTTDRRTFPYGRLAFGEKTGVTRTLGEPSAARACFGSGAAQCPRSRHQATIPVSVGGTKMLLLLVLWFAT